MNIKAYSEKSLRNIFNRSIIAVSLLTVTISLMVTMYITNKNSQQERLNYYKNIHNTVNELMRSALTMSDYGAIQKVLGSVSNKDEISTVISSEGDILLSDYSNYGLVASLKKFIRSENNCKELPESLKYKEKTYKIYCHEMKMQNRLKGKDATVGLLLTLVPGWHINSPSYVFVYLISISLLSVVILVSFLRLVVRKKILMPIERVTREITKMSEMPLEKKYLEIENLKEANEIVLLVKSFVELFENLKKHQEQAEINTKFISIGHTTAILAHDVRKPFTKLKAMLNYFDDYKNSSGQLENAKQEIDKSIKHVESMINDIMDFSREVKLETKPEALVDMFDFSIREVAQQEVVHISSFVSREEETEIAIRFEYNFQHTHQPLADNERLVRVFSNIIGNGIEAITVIGKKNEGTIAITTQDVIKNDTSFIEITIANDGPPIPEEDIPKLFESFFTKGKQKGTGLGLASAQKLINLHGGEIVGRNKNTKDGVEFIMTVPASDEKEVIDISKLPKNNREAAFVTLKKDTYELDTIIETLKDQHFNILLLEDESLYRQAVKSLINKHEILKNIIILYDAHTVDEALSIIEKENITHAIVDIDLGEMQTGFDFLEILHRALKTENRSPLCMVHSNRHLDEFKQKAFSLGAKAFVPKPLALEHLVDFLDSGEEEKLKTKDQSLETRNQKQEPRILVIDDDPMLLNGNTKTLERYFKTRAIYKAMNPEEAFELIKNTQVDYIFCDIYFDNSTYTGYDFVKEVRKDNPDIPIYLVSSESRCIGESKALECGANGFIEQILNETKIENALSAEPIKIESPTPQPENLVLAKIFHDLKKPHVRYSYLAQKIKNCSDNEFEKLHNELIMNFEYVRNLLDILQRYLHENKIMINDPEYRAEFEKEFEHFIQEEEAITSMPQEEGGSYVKAKNERLSS